MITLQTTVGAQTNMTYYFEILNSYAQLWKRIPVTKRAYAQYQITLPVGKTTKPQIRSAQNDQTARYNWQPLSSLQLLP